MPTRASAWSVSSSGWRSSWCVRSRALVEKSCISLHCLQQPPLPRLQLDAHRRQGQRARHMHAHAALPMVEDVADPHDSISFSLWRRAGGGAEGTQGGRLRPGPGRWQWQRPPLEEGLQRRPAGPRPGMRSRAAGGARCACGGATEQATHVYNNHSIEQCHFGFHAAAWYDWRCRNFRAQLRRATPPSLFLIVIVSQRFVAHHLQAHQRRAGVRAPSFQASNAGAAGGG